MSIYSDYDKADILFDVGVLSRKLLYRIAECEQKIQSNAWPYNDKLCTLFTYVRREVEDLIQLLEEGGEDD